MVLAVVAAYFAASRPAKAITKVPVRPGAVGPTGSAAPDPPLRHPRHRLPRPGVLVTGLRRWHQPRQRKWRRSGAPPRDRAPHPRAGSCWRPSSCHWRPASVRRYAIATRLALRDLARYRARSGSALAAISLGVLVAVIVMLAAASRYGNVLDYGVRTWPPTRSGPPRQHAPTAGNDGWSFYATGSHVVQATHHAGGELRTELARAWPRSPRALGSAHPPRDSEGGECLGGTQGGRQWDGRDLRGHAATAAGVRDHAARRLTRTRTC